MKKSQKRESENDGRKVLSTEVKRGELQEGAMENTEMPSESLGERKQSKASC